jgi:hypothetical protein
MLSVVALLCAAGIARADCSQENAIDVIEMGQAANELSCMQDSMMTLAALAIRAGPDEYWKVTCVFPREPVSIVAGRGDDAQDQVSAPVP